MVNNLAALASQYECAIITVMHQNKGKDNTQMKGHIGTLLYQKSCDVFDVAKIGDIFAVHHIVSRHGNIEDFYFNIVDGKPSGYSSESAHQLEKEIANQRAKLKMENLCLTDKDLDEIFGDFDRVLSKDMMVAIMEMYDCSLASAYKVVSNTILKGKLKKENKMFSR